MKKPIGFLTDVDTAMKFFELCEEREAVTTEERMAIMRELMAKEIKDVDELRRLTKGKKIAMIRNKKQVQDMDSPFDPGV